MQGCMRHIIKGTFIAFVLAFFAALVWAMYFGNSFFTGPELSDNQQLTRALRQLGYVVAGAVGLGYLIQFLAYIGVLQSKDSGYTTTDVRGIRWRVTERDEHMGTSRRRIIESHTRTWGRFWRQVIAVVLVVWLGLALSYQLLTLDWADPIGMAPVWLGMPLYMHCLAGMLSIIGVMMAFASLMGWWGDD